MTQSFLDKSSLRKQILAQRKNLSVAQMEYASQNLAQKFQPLIQKYHPKIIASYQPIRNEISPIYIEQMLKEHDIVIIYPRIVEQDKPLIFHEGTKFITGKYGISEPHPDNIVHIPDMVLCPLVGVTQDGIRLGYGGGYYDRTLQALDYPVAVGLGYDFQLLENLPCDDYDVKMNDVIVGQSEVMGFMQSPCHSEAKPKNLP